MNDCQTFIENDTRQVSKEEEDDDDEDCVEFQHYNSTLISCMNLLVLSTLSKPLVIPLICF